MVWSSFALGKRPYVSPTRQTVSKLVTSSSQNVHFYPFSFQSLAHSSVQSRSTTSLQSYSSALFGKNTGGGYTPQNQWFVFSGLPTLQGLEPWPERSLSLHEHWTRVTEHGPASVSLWLGCLCWLSGPRNFLASETSNENHS